MADELYSAFEGNLFSCAIFLDVSKTFDTVDHDVLLRKLWKFGFLGLFHSLLANLLDGRSQIVSVHNVNITLRMLQDGVPQGSVLCPLLFNIYVNDLESVISGCRIFQYADDTLQVSRHVDFFRAVNILQCNVIKLIDGSSANHTKVNPSRTRLMCFRNPLKTGFSSVRIFLHNFACKPYFVRQLPGQTQLDIWALFVNTICLGMKI